MKGLFSSAPYNNSCYTHRATEAQAEISFKAGIREVVEQYKTMAVKVELKALLDKLWTMDGDVEAILNNGVLTINRIAYWEGHRDRINNVRDYIKCRLDKIEKEC